jgi:hypothetical protein
MDSTQYRAVCARLLRKHYGLALAEVGLEGPDALGRHAASCQPWAVVSLIAAKHGLVRLNTGRAGWGCATELTLADQVAALAEMVDWSRVPFSVAPTLRTLGAGHVPYRQALSYAQSGLISPAVWRWYRFFWIWGAYRLSDVDGAAALQARCIRCHGAGFMERRFARVLRLRSAMLENAAAPYLRC